MFLHRWLVSIFSRGGARSSRARMPTSNALLSRDDSAEDEAVGRRGDDMYGWAAILGEYSDVFVVLRIP